MSCVFCDNSTGHYTTVYTFVHRDIEYTDFCAAYIRTCTKVGMTHKFANGALQQLQQNIYIHSHIGPV